MLKLTTPELLLDEQKCKANIKRMTDKAQRHNLIFRPHFKTHQSAEVGNLFKEYGIEAITVSSVKMAGFFVARGWNDITVAFPVNVNEYMDINKLAANCNFNITIENREAVEFLNQNLKNEVGVFIKLDAGYHRTGIDIEAFDAIAFLAGMIHQSKVLKLKGFLIHNGHTYHADSPHQILSFHNASLEKIKIFKGKLQNAGIGGIISIGDTPALSLTENFDGVDEIRPGNFVFYDLMQHNLGCCRFGDIAVALACPVVAKHAARNEIVVYGGAVHLSKEYIEINDGQRLYGKIVGLAENGWSEPLEDSYIKSLSQEHGIIKIAKKYFDEIKTGDFIGALPVHSCLTVAAMPRLITLSGKKYMLHPWL
jgi:D-serine deaminase-like pyridoxal phosphate-dependent protein